MRSGDCQRSGATGYLDTNYGGKAEYALREISRKDFVYVHLEAPDEASHNGNLKDKIQAIEDFDQKIVGPILQGLEKSGTSGFWHSPTIRLPSF